MKISRSKTEHFTTDTNGDQQATIRLNGEMLKRVKSFKYLGSMVEETGEMGKEVKWLNFIKQWSDLQWHTGLKRHL